MLIIDIIVFACARSFEEYYVEYVYPKRRFLGATNVEKRIIWPGGLDNWELLVLHHNKLNCRAK